ncbi:MAG TPA: YdcF family protein [Ilumatobacteraceae bacterium]|nr:YdcF family protein [Ilumatobacteraceae bacterium]
MLISAMVAGLPVYVRPQLDPLRDADAILVLGGYGEERYLKGTELAMAGWAPNLVVSNAVGAGDVWKRNYCSTPPAGVRVHCFIPDPPTTKGEGRELRRLASLYGWRTVIVVTFRPHVSRARYILEQCFGGDLVMVAASPDISMLRWAYEYVYQTAGYLRALLQPDC